MNDWDIIIPIVVESLPDSISARCRALEAVIAVAPRNHPGAIKARSLLRALIDHSLQQREFNLDADTRGGSRLGDNPVERSASARRGR